MHLTHNGSVYIALCTYEEKSVPKRAGFRWDRAAKRWATTDFFAAAKLHQYADAKAMTELKRQKQDVIAAQEASRAEDCDVDIPCNPGMAYMPFQKAGIAYAVKRKGVLIGDQMGLGKGLTLSTVLPTMDGMGITIADIKYGDTVLGSNGKPVKVTGVYYQGLQDIYRITFWDGTHIDCDSSHLWNVTDYNAKRRIRVHGTEWMTKSTRELYEATPASIGFRWHLPLCEPIQNPEADLPIESYTMGIIIAEGYCGEKACSISVSIGDIDSDIIDYLEKPNTIRQKAGCKSVRILGCVPKITALGLRVLSADKHIPRIYMSGSIRQRKSLLAGLLDGDGSCTKNRTTYHTCSYRLAKDVKELVASLGGIAKIRRYFREDKGVEFQVNVKTLFNPFRCKRKSSLWSLPSKSQQAHRTIVSIEKLPEQQETICISVDSEDKLFLCGDDYVVTHNTVQALGVLNHWIDKGKFLNVLVICPASLKINWMRELDKWLVRPCRTVIHNGRDCKPDVKHDGDGSNIHIVNYDILGGMAAIRKDWDVIIADEAHKIKNCKTRKYKAFKKLTAKQRIALTGTPIPNRPSEIFTTLNWLDPVEWGSWWSFVNKYCNAQQGKWGLDVSGSSNLDELQQRLRSTLMVRRRKEDVLKELPPKTRQVIEVPADSLESYVEHEWQAYRSVETLAAKLRAAVELAKASDDENEYRQAVKNLKAGTAAAFTELARARVELAEKKVPLVIAHLEDINDHPVVFFAHHKVMIDPVVQHFKTPCVITGSVSNENRQRAVDRFQTGMEKLFVGNILAAGVGLTLTASSHVVFGELDWTPANISQAEDRSHRHGQQDNVLVQHIVVESSLDSVMAGKIIRKQEIIDAALDNRVGDEAFEDHGPMICTDYATESVTRKAIQKEAMKLSPEAIRYAHKGVQIIAALCNRARVQDGIGFSKVDVGIGHSLASQSGMSPKQAVIAVKLCRKYKKQLGEEFVAGLNKLIGGQNENTGE